MSKFSIILTDKLRINGDEKMALGKISIGDFSEKFYASLSYWDSEQYIFHWKQSLEKIINGEQTSALITSMYDPKISNFIFWWLLYQEDKNIYVQNHILLMDNIDCLINEKNVYNYIPNREIIDEEGNRISEWITSLEAIKAFLTLY